MKSLIPHTVPLEVSGQRFRVQYRIAAPSREKAEGLIQDLCFEQTVEFPEELVPRGTLLESMPGRLEQLAGVEDGFFLADISFPVEASGDDLAQLLNVILGNSSLKPGIRAEKLELAPSQAKLFRGPRFGRKGLRALLGVPERPLLSTALKPMGLAPVDLAEMAYRFALGGIDLIKDDHGLTHQTFCPFDERVKRCSDAVARANRETGQHCLYLPNVTSSPEELFRRARAARAAGAGGLLICPGLAGFEVMRALADADDIALPILSHPAFLGSFIVDPSSGFSHFTIFGQIQRLAGADASIFPNFGGRFSFSSQECQNLAAGTEVAMGSIPPIFPAPAGGLTLARVQELDQVYGRDIIILVGGGLFQHGDDLVENCRYFRSLTDRKAGSRV